MKKHLKEAIYRMNLCFGRKLRSIIIPIILCFILVTCGACATNNAGDINTDSTIDTKVFETTESVTNPQDTSSSIIETYKKAEVSVFLASPTEAVTEPSLVETYPLETEVVVDYTGEQTNGSYEDSDLFYLAAAICNEAGGSSEEIQLLVANVVINRVNSPLFPNTIYDVLTQHMQYGMMWKYGVDFPEWASQEVKDRCYDVAQRILEGERVCPEDVVFQAEFIQGSGIYKEIDGFYFCYY